MAISSSTPKTGQPVVAILGRPNVGKSALFNRLVGRRQALVDSTPGLTRDRLYGDVTWRGCRFRLVDTGGLQFSKGDRMVQAIAGQVKRAMQEATLAILVCDVQDGVVPLDREVAHWLRQWGKPVIVVVNKVDTERSAPGVQEFAGLGLGEPMEVSSLHGRSIGDLLDAIVRSLPRPTAPAPSSAPAAIRVAVVGRPNVGKSSLVNRLLNEERVIVDERPGTTLDPVEVELSYQGKEFRLVDTAGLRAQRRLKTRVDAVARLKSLEVIRRADVCLGVLEAPAGLRHDDLRLLDQVITAGRPLCLALNKWDLLPASSDEKAAAAAVARRAPFLAFAPVLCISAKTGYHVLGLLGRLADLAAVSRRRLTSAECRKLLEQIRTEPRAPSAVRNALLIRLSQVSVAPPVFHLLARTAKPLRQSDLSFLEGRIRRLAGFEGAPIRLHLLRAKR